MNATASQRSVKSSEAAPRSDIRAVERPARKPERRGLAARSRRNVLVLAAVAIITLSATLLFALGGLNYCLMPLAFVMLLIVTLHVATAIYFGYAFET